MADTKISLLPAATTPLDGTEELPIVQDAETRRVPVSDLRGCKPWYFDPPAAADFTLTSSAGPNLSLTDDADVGLLVDAAAVSSAGVIRVAYKTLPSGDQTFTMRMPLALNNVSFRWFALFVWDSISDRYTIIETVNSGGSLIRASNWTGATFSAAVGTGYTEFSGLILWKRIRRVGSNLFYEISFEGKNWIELYTASETAWMTNAPNRCGFLTGSTISGAGAVPKAYIDHWSQTW